MFLNHRSEMNGLERGIVGVSSSFHYRARSMVRSVLPMFAVFCFVTVINLAWLIITESVVA